MKGLLYLCFIVLTLGFLADITARAQNTDSTHASQRQDGEQRDQDDQNGSHDHENHPMPNTNGHDSSSTMPVMDMEAHDMDMQPHTFLEAVQHHGVSGTDIEPVSTPGAMLMSMKGNWMLMLHGVAFLADFQQTGPRGSDKLFSTNWIMPMAQRTFGSGTLTLRTMLSFEPATVTHRFYPELFQQGETAFGKPIVDGQHPHNFFMELAAIYDLKLGEKTLLSFYGAPVGDPAIGPPAYPHRASASEDPLATLGHHLQDSTHIADDVITVGVAHGIARLEASGFHGREPDENRWDLDSGKIDSWSTRLTVNPGRNWSGQYSFAHLASPEALHADENVDRMTASIAYNRPLANGNWASLLLWGRNKSQPTGLVWNSYLAESTLRFAGSNYVWGRLENVDRTSELLLKNVVEPVNFEETIIGRVKASTIGYDRDLKLIPRLSTAIGAQATFYGTPNSLKGVYGQHPVGVVVFMRVRLAPTR